jgi:hypothetical protein
MTIILLVCTLTALMTLMLGAIGFYVTFRWLLRHGEQTMGHPPQQTWWEVLFTLKSRRLSSLLLTMQRAESGTPAEHPMGSAPRHDWLQHLGFDTATFRPTPLDADVPVDVAVTVGPGAAQPLHLALPVLIAPMGYGIALSAETKVALAQAATLAGTAIVSGEGPYLPEERAFAERWIAQQNRGTWAHQAPVLKMADMIELQWGQGSEGGSAVSKSGSWLPRRALSATEGHETIHGTPWSLADWVASVKKGRSDCPLGIKLPASQHLEADLAYLMQWPFDVITVDASAAGSAGSPSVLSDHFGLEVALATHRAHRWLSDAGLRSQITLVVSGGIRGAADIARLLILGADATALGSTLLYAALHEQISSHWPLPATEIAFPPSAKNPSPPLHVYQAAEHVARWFQATKTELTLICQAVGVASIAALRQARPLVAHSPEAARIFDLPFDGHSNRKPGAFLPLMDPLSELSDAYRQLNQTLAWIERRYPRPSIPPS